jgi:hypothetical protein
VAVVGRPPVLRGGRDLDDVPLERVDIEVLELLRVAEPSPSGFDRVEC